MIGPVAEKFPYDRNNAYNFVNYDIETNMSGKTTEICQLSAIDQSGLHCFNDYILPMWDADIHAARVNRLSVRSVRGVRTLFKDNQPVKSVSLFPRHNNNNALFTHATSRSNKNSLKMSVKQKTVKTNRKKKLKLPFLNLSKSLLLQKTFKSRNILGVFYMGNEFQIFAAKNEKDLRCHSRL